MIAAAKRPLLVTGAGSNRKRTSRMLSQFIDKTGMPFFSTQMGKGVVDERHPLYLGNAALSANDYLHCAIEHADLIINAGHDVVEKPPFFMQHGGFEVIHINFSSASFDPVYFPGHEVIGDIGNSLWQIMQRLERQDTWDFDYFARVKKYAEARLREGEDDDSFPVLPPRLVSAVRAVMPDTGILALDNGVYKIWFALNYQAHAPNTVLLDNSLATMGAGLPSAMAAKICDPDEKVMAVCGDGGFMMNSQELETAVRLGLNLVVLILKDDGYGMIKWKQQDMGPAGFRPRLRQPGFRPLRRELRGARSPHTEHAGAGAGAAPLSLPPRGARRRGPGRLQHQRPPAEQRAGVPGETGESR